MSTVAPRILVPLDGSRLAESAIAPASEIAAAWGASITLLHVMEPHAPATVHGEPHLTKLGEAQSYLEGWAAKLRAQGTVVDAHAHGPDAGGVAEELASHAREIEADLIVLCAHGSGGWRDFLLGNIAQQTLHRCTQPVLLIRAPWEAGSGLAGRPWVVALEPVRHGSGAVPLVASLSRALHSPLHLLTVVPTRATLPAQRRAQARLAPKSVAAVLDLEAGDAEVNLKELAQRLRKESVQVSEEVLRGDPVREVLASVKRRDVALLIVTTHSKAGLAGLVGGSFAAAAVGATECPMLLVPITK